MTSSAQNWAGRNISNRREERLRMGRGPKELGWEDARSALLSEMRTLIESDLKGESREEMACAALARSAPHLRSAALRSLRPRPRPRTPALSAPSTTTSMLSAARRLSHAPESLLPLHSATAAARLRSFLAADSSYWTPLSQGKYTVNPSLLCLSRFNCLDSIRLNSSLMHKRI